MLYSLTWMHIHPLCLRSFLDDGNIYCRYCVDSMSELIKILFLAANPRDMDPLQLGKESRAIDKALRMSPYRDRFMLADHFAVQVSDLQELLLRYEPHIVHFSGHGTETSEILLVNDDDYAQPVTAEQLANLFRHFAGKVRCVVLNSCFSDLQANHIASVVDCVIGIPDALSDTTAIAFSSAFYRALGYGKDVKTALDLACTDVAMELRTLQFRPQLLSQRIDPSLLTFVHATDQDPSHIVSNTVAVNSPPNDGMPHPVLQQMTGQSANLMLLILVIAVVGVTILVVLPFLLNP
jgi:hypothetical protein